MVFFFRFACFCKISLSPINKPLSMSGTSRTDDYELEEEVLVSSTAIDEEVSHWPNKYLRLQKVNLQKTSPRAFQSFYAWVNFLYVDF